MIWLRFCLFLSLLLWLPYRAAADKPRYISLRATISLLENVHYNKLRLIDRRQDTGRLGDFRGLYSYLNVLTSRPFGEELASLDSNLLGLSVRGDGELMVVLYDHYYRLTKDNVATLTLHADFFLRNVSDSGYRFIYTADSFYEAIHDKSLPAGLFAEYWRRCLLTAVRHGLDTGDNHLYTASEAASRHDAARRMHPVYQMASYPVGVYYSWDEFAWLKPGTTDLKVRHNENNVLTPYEFYIPDSTQKSGRRELEEGDFFAAYDGRHWYKTSSKRIYVMEHGDNGDFYYPGVQKGLTTLSSKGGYVVSAAIVGGLIGAVVVAAVLSDVDKKNEHRDNVLYRMRLGLDGRGVPVLRKE